MEANAKFECFPLLGEARIHDERVGKGSETPESPGERLPDAAHRREMQPAGGRVREVDEVDIGGDTQPAECLLEAAGAREQRGMDTR